MQILIADSDKDSLGNIKEILRLNLTRGTLMEYIETTDGKNTLAELIINKPNLAIIDMNIAKFNAKKILQKIKELGNRDLREIPILIMSPRAEKEIFIELLKLGAKDFIVKPIDMESLIQKVQEFIKHT